jgi:hypothetical protein
MGVARMIVVLQGRDHLCRSHRAAPLANVSLERWANFCPLLSVTTKQASSSRWGESRSDIISGDSRDSAANIGAATTGTQDLRVRPRPPAQAIPRRSLFLSEPNSAIRASGQTVLIWIKWSQQLFAMSCARCSNRRAVNNSVQGAHALAVLPLLLRFHLTAKRTADRRKGIDYDL